MKKTRSMLLIILIVSILPLSAIAIDVDIGTGGIQGVYYPTGINICSIINSVPEYDINCSAVTSGGSIININNVLNNNWEFGIAQSDAQYDAWNGFGSWEGDPQENLRSVFSIHYESVILIAAADSGINNINDLIGKTVNVGPADSGGYQNAIDALSYAEIDLNDLNLRNDYPNDAAVEFQNYNIDAFFITIGNPNSFVLNLSQGDRTIYLVPINTEEDFFDIHPYYTASIIPIEYYKDVLNKKDVPTFGLKATFITSIAVSSDIVYAFTKEIFENFIEFQALNAAYEVLTKNKMLQGLTAPIHPGAMKYFKEVIFLKSSSQNKK